MFGTHIEIEVITKGGETFVEVQEVLQFGWSDPYNCQVAVVDKDSPMYFAYPSGIRLLSLNWESPIASAKVVSWTDVSRELYNDFYY